MLSLYTALQTLAFTTVDRVKSQEKGASAVEYALLVAGIAVIVVTAVKLFGPTLSSMFQNINVSGKTP